MLIRNKICSYLFVLILTALAAGCSEKEVEKNISSDSSRSRETTSETSSESPKSVKAVDVANPSIGDSLKHVSEELKEALLKKSSKEYLLSEGYKELDKAEITFSEDMLSFKGSMIPVANAEGIKDEIEVEGYITDIQEDNGIYTVSYQGGVYYKRGESEKDSSTTIKKGSVSFTSKNTEPLYFTGKKRVLTKEELKELSLDELGYLRNEFYARKGFIFKTTKMKSYFGKMPWYEGRHNTVTLSNTELENVYVIRALEKEIQTGVTHWEEVEVNSLYEISQKRLLTKKDLQSLPHDMLPYLRNTYFARKGYIFKKEKYREYFSGQSWYKPLSGDVAEKLSVKDLRNIHLIQLLEEDM